MKKTTINRIYTYTPLSPPSPSPSPPRRCCSLCHYSNGWGEHQIKIFEHQKIKINIKSMKDPGILNNNLLTDI